ncbi:hypothetical protein D3C84_551960 [compost metagenome]
MPAGLRWLRPEPVRRGRRTSAVAGHGTPARLGGCPVEQATPGRSSTRGQPYAAHHRATTATTRVGLRRLGRKAAKNVSRSCVNQQHSRPGTRRRFRLASRSATVHGQQKKDCSPASANRSNDHRDAPPIPRRACHPTTSHPARRPAAASNRARRAILRDRSTPAPATARFRPAGVHPAPATPPPAVPAAKRRGPSPAAESDDHAWFGSGPSC